MSCDCSHMESTRFEAESRKVAKFLVWVFEHLGEPLPEWVILAANHVYGNSESVDALTAMLCAACERLHDDVIYDGCNRTARQLADWWDDHKEADRIKEEAQQAIAKRAELRKSARSKLTSEERKVIGL